MKWPLVALLAATLLPFSAQAQTKSLDKKKAEAPHLKCLGALTSPGKQEEFDLYVWEITAGLKNPDKYRFLSFRVESLTLSSGVESTVVSSFKEKGPIPMIDVGGDVLVLNSDEFVIADFDKPINYSAFGVISDAKYSGTCLAVPKKDRSGL
ncbi:hypothetical protein ACFOWX_07200 [Sphingorhabdus arenilitoris]|uniref:Uncharacterized protein n=1 Tax=Sphingorhabdus arenilitoris TaxID=1490041 RepID=A0ABV8RHQ1_9SPHN